MRLHRFFFPEPVGNRTELTICSFALVNQLRRVFRFKIGEDIVIFDGSGSDYKATIAHFEGVDCVVLEHLNPSPSCYMPKQKTFLAVALIKKDHFEMLAEKATELGVTDIVPIMAERSEKKALNYERLQKIVIEASEQSGRGNVPKLHPICTPVDFLVSQPSAGEQANYLAFDPQGSPWKLDERARASSTALLIGPEGGWSDNEITLFHEQGIRLVSLGSQILRAETAVIATLSLILLNQNV